MWPIIGIVLAGIIISLVEIPPRVKKKNWREIIVYFLFLIPGLTLSILINLRMEIPTPLDWVMKVFSPITNFVDQFLT